MNLICIYFLFYILFIYIYIFMLYYIICYVLLYVYFLYIIMSIQSRKLFSLCIIFNAIKYIQASK